VFTKVIQKPIVKGIAILLLLVTTLSLMAACSGPESTPTTTPAVSNASLGTSTPATSTTPPVVTKTTTALTTQPNTTATTAPTSTKTTAPATTEPVTPAAPATTTLEPPVTTTPAVSETTTPTTTVTATPTPTPTTTPTTSTTTTAASMGGGGGGGGSSTSLKPVANLRIGTTFSCDQNFSMVTSTGSFLRMNMYSFCAAPFLEYDQDGKILPYIMTKWVIADDNKSLLATFATNKGITWHDGQPLTIDDIIFTFTVNKNGLKASSDIDHVEKVNDTQLKMYFTTTAFGFINKIVGGTYVFPKHVWENVADPKAYTGADATIGCGPYKFVGSDQDAQTIYYEAVDHYFKGTLLVKKVSVRSFGSADSLILAMKNGEIDAMNNYSSGLDASALPAITGVKNLNTGKSVNPGNYQLDFGFINPPTNDLQFRKAVSYALNYKLLATSIGGDVPHAGIIAPPNVGFISSLPSLKQDLKLANSTLEAAGYKDIDKDGFREDPSGNAMNLVIITQVNKSKGAIFARIAEVVASNLNAVGIKTTIDEKSLTDQTYSLNLYRTYNYQLYVSLTSSGWAHYQTAFSYMIMGGSPTGGTCDIPEVVEAYNAMMSAGSTAEYIENVQTLQQLASKYTFGLALCWDNTYFPFRIDKYAGWVNFPGVGVINGQTWYKVGMK
jgi:peptide/nickel transport system substrate-binding protein